MPMNREEVCLLLNSNKEAQNLSEKLKKIHLVLSDAEQKGVADPRIMSWLEKLQNIAYEIDDVLDEWELENIRQKLDDVANNCHEESSSDHDGIDSWETKVCFFLQSVCLCFKQTVQRRSIALDIKGINERLDSIARENENEFKFIPNLVGESNQDIRRVITTSFVDVSEIHGRSDDKNTLMSKLLSDQSSSQGGDDGVQTISIVGAGGMGKTTLAQLVFNEFKVGEMKEQFQVRIWICVSDPFDEIKIARAILESLNRSAPNLSEFETLLEYIKESISGKKFFLVLDDVWTEEDSKWIPLKVSLKSGAPGSRILVTTRKTRVAQIIGTTYVHSLSPLSDSYCWSVLSQIALQDRGEADREMLEETGMEIAKKCKGLPLAAKTVGGLLRFKTSLQEWQNVLKSDMWGLEKVRKDLFPCLMLSYNELHPQVKRCFSYCAIFPKDKEINVDELIRIWMAHSFLLSNDPSTETELEQIGFDYFDSLATRSFCQDFTKDEAGNNRIVTCKMHDIVHDFAQFLTKNECLIVERVDAGANQVVPAQNARHLTLLHTGGTTDTEPFAIWPIEKLRTCFWDRNRNPYYLFSHLKRVRLLSLRACNLKDIPKEIGSLIHLRYLDLSHNFMKNLPETIYGLCYLQTLAVEHCYSLHGLPAQGIHKLVNLRHLLNSGGFIVDFRFPQGFEKLTNLRTLDEFRVYVNGNKLECLKDLNNLGGSLRIVIGKYTDEHEAQRAYLRSKKFIQELKLTTGHGRIEATEALQPHPNLQILHFRGFPFPKWITTLPNLRSLIINGTHMACPRIAYSLPPLGKLPLLEYLKVDEWGMQHVGHEFLGIGETEPSNSSCTLVLFPKLRTLSFKDCKWWREWEDINEEREKDISIAIFPCLQELQLTGCWSFKTLPYRLIRKASSLQSLRMIVCYEPKKGYVQETRQDWSRLSHIPKVEIW
ncbi:UNVERIFIED_CONTAM: putative disease resistance protein RGA3 [Sesamum radiatum]|uniref:Disease resistance protein RGA3 n=1 Tax=Sesamum radiatum TaxID=300843 RepID=A0AAW2UEJ1_SESRA